MKKCIARLLLFTVFFGMIPLCAKAESTEKAYKAQILINALTDNEVSFGETITRMDFVVALAKTFQLGETVPEKYFYGDVKSFTENAGFIYSAYNFGWIDAAENFNAEYLIEGREAVKIAVNALGYKLLAENAGGYPQGYLVAASEINLLKGVDLKETLSAEDAYKLIYNILTTNIFEQISYGKVSEYAKKNETPLSRIYDVYEISGVISRTGYNSLDGREREKFVPEIEIEGNVYLCKNQSYEMLGIKQQVFVKDNGKEKPEVVCMFEDIDDSITISLHDFARKDSGKLYWYDSETGKEKSASIKSPVVIYNGRRVLGGTDQCFKAGTGSLRLVSNYGGAYDVVLINSYSFAEVYSMDTLDDILRDKNSSAYTVDMSNAVYQIFDENGKEIDKFDISSNEVFRVLRSEDNGFVELKRIAKKLTGTITAKTEEKLIIDDIEYDMTAYFQDVYSEKIHLNTKTTFSVTNEGEVVSMALTDSGMLYAYAVAAKSENKLNGTLTVKLFSQTGEMQILNTDTAVYLDGVLCTDMTAVSSAFSEGGEFKPQLVRYGVTADGKLKALDFATSTVPDTLDASGDERNKLTYYGTKSGIYKSYGATISRYFHINSSVAFVIPEDISKTEDFRVVGKAYFVNNTTYELDYFDLDETGGAGAIVYHSADSGNIAMSVVPVVVQSVNGAVNDDGEVGYNINYFDGAAFGTVFLPEDVPFSKSFPSGTVRNSSHSILSGGDVIRFEKNTVGKVSKLEVEFDAREGVMAINNTSSNVSRWNSDQSNNPQFHCGQVYSYNSTNMVISNSRQLDGTYRFRPSDLHVLHGTTNQVCYNVKTGQVRPITNEQVKVYQSDGDDAYFAVVCQDTFISKFIVYYEDIRRSSHDET